MKNRLVIVAAAVVAVPLNAFGQDIPSVEIVPGLNGYATTIDKQTGAIQCQIPPARYADRYIFFRTLQANRETGIMSAETNGVVNGEDRYVSRYKAQAVERSYEEADLRCDQELSRRAASASGSGRKRPLTKRRR